MYVCAYYTPWENLCLMEKNATFLLNLLYGLIVWSAKSDENCMLHFDAVSASLVPAHKLYVDKRCC